MARTPSEVTRLLVDWGNGDERALAELMPLVYGELRHKAREFLRHERPDHTLGATALVHEAYLRLIQQERVSWRNRAQFYGLAAQMMRRVLVDHARRLGYSKRGGGIPGVPLDEVLEVSAERAPELIALDDCLKSLAITDPQLARVVELRYFGGLTSEEIGEVLQMSIPTVTRRWRVAKAWLYSRLAGEDHEP